MSNLIKSSGFVGEIKKVVSPKEYLGMVKRESTRNKIQSVKFIKPELGKSNNLGKFMVTIK